VSRREVALGAVVAVVAGFAVLELVSLVLVARTFSVVPPGANTGADDVRDVLVSVVFVTVGAVLASKRPANAIGWLFLATGCANAVVLFTARYGLYGALLHPGSLPGANVAASLSTTAWVGLFVPIGFLLICFPQGHPLSRRWWVGIGVVAFGATIGWIGGTTVPGKLPQPFETLDNPLGVKALAGIDNLIYLGAWLMIVVSALAGVSLILRFRRSTGIEREQYKGFAFAAALFPLAIVVTQSLYAVNYTAGEIASWLVAGVACLLPVATAVAILRYRLYEIDRLISRTISYTILTGLLVGVFLGIVLLATRVLPFSSPVAVAVSTLAAAALFNPLRRKIQHTVDRRFNRSSYDQDAIVADFRTQLRTATDLDEVRTSLQTTVDGAVQPAHTTLWLRQAGKH
jgi:hypothetical protein